MDLGRPVEEGQLPRELGFRTRLGAGPRKWYSRRMPTDADRGRQALETWVAEKPKNLFRWDQNLGRVLELRLGKERFQGERERFEQVGAMVATRLSELAVDTNHDANLPRLDRYD